MTGSSKFSLLIQPGLEDPLQPGYRSMRFDPMVWKEWEKLGDNESDRIRELIPGEILNPGNFALYLLNPELITLDYPNEKLQTPFLEDCMNEFQLFLQNQQPPSELVQATKLMIVLSEKRKISPNWTAVTSELTTRFHDGESENFIAKWKTAFGLLVNIVSDREDFVSSMCNSQSWQIYEKMLIPVMMMLCQSDTERVDLGVKSMGLLKPEQQVITRELILLLRLPKLIGIYQMEI